MAIQENGVSAVSVGELLTQNLTIPEYQRPYSWAPAMALQLLDDLVDAQAKSERHPYVLGAVILHECDGILNVVDGQQRLLTLRMIFSILKADGELSLDAKNENAVTKVWRELQRKLNGMNADKKRALFDFISTQCQVVRIVTDDLDEAFRVFDSQNYRGKPLAPHDLLKAHHLREMQDESAAMKVAVVEAWESVKDDVLDRLFSTFLYRIARWSRGHSAPGFVIEDIGMFKGISRKAHGDLSPHERYHLAAQAAVPLLNTWASGAGPDDRNAGRSRFPLDAPLVAGRPFFEMVSFMLKELATLEAEVKTDFGDFNESQSRYRYVYQLFMAALLYHTNKFGEQEKSEFRDRLFAWSYALRVELKRVQFKSMDNKARGKEDAEQSVFILLRKAMTGRAIRQLNTTSKPYDSGHEKNLLNFIEKMNTNDSIYFKARVAVH